MTSSKKTPPIVQIGAWVLALFVFAVGFWHTHLGLKEMKPFGSEWGGLVIASIVLLLLLITYWFAVNGRKMALIFYVLCGVIFLVCNLNYFYPAYMARTLLQEDASALKDTIDNYANVNVFSNKAYANHEKLVSYKQEYFNQIRGNNGQGVKALDALKEFNAILIESGCAQVSSFDTRAVSDEQLGIWEQRFDGAIEEFDKKNVGEGILDAVAVIDAKSTMDSLKRFAIPALSEIAKDESSIKLDSVKFHPQVKYIKSVFFRLKSAVIQFNKGSKKNILAELDEKKNLHVDELERIQNTFITIGERINQISTWAIIILCLFIDLVVPLAIYLLLRKTGDEPEDKSLKGKMRPGSF